jgi:hypothetical protein
MSRPVGTGIRQSRSRSFVACRFAFGTAGASGECGRSTTGSSTVVSAASQARFDRYGIDTVAVVYVLRPLAPYDGPSSSHSLSDVRFVGEPGIP